MVMEQSGFSSITFTHNSLALRAVKMVSDVRFVLPLAAITSPVSGSTARPFLLMILVKYLVQIRLFYRSI